MNVFDPFFDNTLIIPPGRGELLALLHRPDFCRAALQRAEQAENYAACAKWLQALDSGLPFIVNAIVPFSPDGAILVCDVSSLAELLRVLDEVGQECRCNDERTPYGFAVYHAERSDRGYWFEAVNVGKNLRDGLVYLGSAPVYDVSE